MFFDKKSILDMQHWQDALKKGLRQSKVMLAVLSEAYFQSEWCRREWEEYMITPPDSRRLQVIMGVIEPGAGSGREPYTHNSDEECVIVLKGRVHVRVADDSYELSKGDSVTFESRLPHSYRNPGPGRSEVLWVMTPPSY